MPRKQFLSLSILGLLGIPAFSVCANPYTDDNEMLTLSLEQLSRVKIITSTLQEETPQSVPASISVFQRDDIEKLGITRLEELMNHVPGYQSSRSDDAGFINGYSSRGRRNGNTGREVLVLIDGKRLNSDFSGGAGFFDPGISLENVERVEFIRGPGSSIYGSNAIMGVVNVITRAQRGVDIRVGSHRLREASAQWRAGDDRAGLQLFAKYGEDEGEALTIYNADAAVRAFVESRDPQQWGEAYLRANVGKVTLSTRWSQRKGQDFYASGYVADDINEASAESLFASLEWLHEFSDAVSLQATLFSSDHQFDLESMLQSTPVVYANPVIYEREAGAELVLRGVHERQRWLLGGEFRQPDLYDTSITLRSPVPSPELNSSSLQVEEGHRTIRGHYGQYQYDFTRDTSAILGVRHDDYSDFGHRSSPRVGVIHQLNRRDTVKLLYGEAFRAPNRAATGIRNSPTLVGNPGLEPEVAKTAELVWLHTLDRGQFSTALFDTRIEDSIQEVATGATSQRTWINRDETVSGLELELTYRFAPAWSARMAATHIFDEVNAINPDASTLLSLALVYSRERWVASVRASYQGEREDAVDTDANAATEEYRSIDGRTLVAVHASYQLLPELQLYGNVTNLFDEQYRSNAQRYTNTEGVPERGIAANAGVKFSF